MEQSTSLIYTSNQTSNTIHGNNAIVTNYSLMYNIVQQNEANSKIQRLFVLLNPLVSSTRVGSDVPRNGCMAGTRHELLQQICTLPSDVYPSHVCLILGLAGIGKSALARSIADTFTKSDLLVASYFISRHIPQSRKPERLVQTLAYQLGEQDATICDALLTMLSSDPGLLQHQIEVQVQQLLVSPLTLAQDTVTLPLAIIVDGLDESEDILKLLSKVVEPIVMALSGIPRRVKLILSSRESEALRAARSEGVLQRTAGVRWMHEIDEATTRSDMRMFIADGLGRISQRVKLGPDWPTDAQIDTLTNRAGSLFIYATTVLHFLGERQYSPKTRLEQLLSSNRLPQAANSDLLPFAELDALYLEVLLSFVGTPLSLKCFLIQNLRLVLAAVIYAAEPMSTRMLSGILGIHLDNLEPIIRGLAAIWLVPDDRDKQITVYHLSFSEFISDPARCTEQFLYLPPAIGHELLASACLRRMAKTLRQDMFHLIKPGSPLPYIEAYSLGIIEDSVDLSLRYACLYGVDNHFRRFLACQTSAQIRGAPPAFVREFAKFCDQHLLHWVEVRAVFGEESLNALIQTLHHLTETLPIRDIAALTRASKLLAELHDMVYEFQTLILKSPLEIYSSCLALLQGGYLVSTYERHLDVMVRRVTPRPDAWLHARRLFSQAAIATCIATEGNWTACGLVAKHDDGSSGQSYILLWPAIPTAPFRLEIPHADNFVLQSMAFSAGTDNLITLSKPSSSSISQSKSGAFITVWDLATQRMISLRQVAMSVLGISFNMSGSHILCVTGHPQEPVVRLTILLDGSIPRSLDSGGWYEASFSANRSCVAFGALGGPLFIAGEPSSWRPIMLPESSRPYGRSGWEPPTGPHEARILISSDGDVIVANFLGRQPGRFTLRAWSLACFESPQVSAVFVPPFDSDGIIGMPAISSDGRLLAFCAPGSTNDKPLFTLGELKWGDQPHFASFASWYCDGGMRAQFSKDGSLIGGVDGRRTLRVWNIESGSEIAQVAENAGSSDDLRSAPGSSSELMATTSGVGPADSSLFSDLHAMIGNNVRPSKRIASAVEVLPSAISESSLHLSFTNTGVIGSWNTAGQSHAVFLLVRRELYQAVHRPSQSHNWWVTAEVPEWTRFREVPASDKIGIALEPKELILFELAVDNTVVVVVFGNRIVGLSTSSLHGRVFETEFIVNTAVLSIDRKALVVTDMAKGRILVVALHSDGIEFHQQRTLAWDEILEDIETDAEGFHLKIRSSRPPRDSEPSQYSDLPPPRGLQKRVFLQLPPQRTAPDRRSKYVPPSQPRHLRLATSQPRHWLIAAIHRWIGQWFDNVQRPEEMYTGGMWSLSSGDLWSSPRSEIRYGGCGGRLLSDDDIRLFVRNIYMLSHGDDFPSFIKNMPQLGMRRHPFGGVLLWRRPMLYLNAAQGGVMVFDFSHHPALQPAPPAEEDKDANPELSEYGQTVEPALSDDECYEAEESGEE